MYLDTQDVHVIAKGVYSSLLMDVLSNKNKLEGTSGDHYFIDTNSKSFGVVDECTHATGFALRKIARHCLFRWHNHGGSHAAADSRDEQLFEF